MFAFIPILAAIAAASVSYDGIDTNLFIFPSAIGGLSTNAVVAKFRPGAEPGSFRGIALGQTNTIPTGVMPIDNLRPGLCVNYIDTREPRLVFGQRATIYWTFDNSTAAAAYIEWTSADQDRLASSIMRAFGFAMTIPNSNMSIWQGANTTVVMYRDAIALTIFSHKSYRIGCGGIARYGQFDHEERDSISARQEDDRQRSTNH